MRYFRPGEILKFVQGVHVELSNPFIIKESKRIGFRLITTFK
ncbi:hypothetical protein [Paenibacillus sp. yr247]|nr:hypothetical protein [Paenibacillus sp. yr247]